MILDELAQVLENRKTEDPEQSYVASLYHGGVDKILKKVGEEASETIMAAKDAAAGVPDGAKNLTHEVADLWFHTMVLLAHQGLSHNDVLNVLAERFGVSGHDEKASRPK